MSTGHSDLRPPDAIADDRVTRLRSELALVELHFRQTFDDAPTGIMLSSLDRRILRVNPAMCELLGYPESELVGPTLDHITHPDDHAADLEGARAMLAGETPNYRTVKRYRHRSGRLVHAQLWVSLVRDLLGDPSHFTVHVVDVSAAHEAKAGAEEARRLLDESQQIARVGSWSFAYDTGELSWSDGQFRLHGLRARPGPLAVADFLATLPADERPQSAARIKRRIADRRGFQAEYRVLHPDGSVHVLATDADVLPADSRTGQPWRISGITRDVTAERAAQSDQRAVEQRHGRLLASLPDTMVVLADAALRCVLVQGPLAAELRIDPERATGRLIAELIGPQLLACVQPHLETALRGETSTLTLVDGGRTVQVQAAPYVDGHGATTGAFTVWRDVTASIRREHENRMLATMVQQSEDAIIAKDRDGRIVEFNRGAERLYGYARAEVIGRPIALLVPAELDGEDRELLAEALAGRSTQRETIRRRKDGRHVNVSVSVSPLLDSDGSVIGASSIARDITPRIREQTARREIEDRLRVTVDHAPIGVALVDLRGDSRGRLLSANEPFATLLGDPDPVAGGLSLSTVAHPEDVAALRADLMLLSCDEQARTETEIRCVRSDGSIVWLLLSGAAVPHADGCGEPPRLAVVHALDIGERKRLEGRLQHLADHDALTGLFNRRRFETELTRAVAHVHRYRRPGALLLVDLDGFKHVNDSMGHAFGDELITRVGATLRDVVRETDVIARLGGDEFALILTAVTETEAVAVGEKLLSAIQQHGVVLSEQRHAGVTASIGITLLSAGDRLDSEELLVEADAAMYLAKQAGRNRVALAHRDGAGEARLSARRSWHARLRTAIERESFELFAQPIRPICASGIDHYELLLRMRDEDGELVAPAAFLPGAERYDLVQRIDRWVFGQALKLLAANAAAGRDVGLSVNMSGKTLCDATLVPDLVAMVDACPIPRDRLVVEVTETAAIVNIERARTIARALRELGCRFALDDFGAGFASFYYLKHLEFDFVKIDGEFVRTLASNPTDQLVVRSVVDLARGLGAETIAEFVGDEDAIHRLRELGVDYGQGYHLGLPAPVHEILPAGIG